MTIKVESIPEAHYPEYRLGVIFDAYKWDLQAGEQSTISDKVVLLEPTDAEFLEQNAVKLYHETIAMELALKNKPGLAMELGMSQPMSEALKACSYNPSGHIRFMRFDFHPTTDGWQVSEVNSDVPAGYPEASILPLLAKPYFDGYKKYGCFGTVLKNRLKGLVPSGATIAYLHDSHIVEDYQILRYIGDTMEAEGYKSMYTSPEHLRWQDGIAEGVGGIMRYFPAECLEFTDGVDWAGYANAQTPSCNHPIALLTQSKRLPLVWDRLGVSVPAWKMLLPETTEVSEKISEKVSSSAGWVLKPAFGRVGEGINIPGTVPKEEEEAIATAAKSDPNQWVMQKMFQSVPVSGLHLNIGVFVIDGEFAGMYARGSVEPKIDDEASEIPVLVREV